MPTEFMAKMGNTKSGRDREDGVGMWRTKEGRGRQEEKMCEVETQTVNDSGYAGRGYMFINLILMRQVRNRVAASCRARTRTQPWPR
jgi:hypothetical protein